MRHHIAGILKLTVAFPLLEHCPRFVVMELDVSIDFYDNASDEKVGTTIIDLHLLLERDFCFDALRLCPRLGDTFRLGISRLQYPTEFTHPWNSSKLFQFLFQQKRLSILLTQIGFHSDKPLCERSPSAEISNRAFHCGEANPLMLRDFV